MVVWWRELGEVENESTSHNFSLFAIIERKIINIGKNFTKFWEKQFCAVFLRHGVQRRFGLFTGLQSQSHAAHFEYPG